MEHYDAYESYRQVTWKNTLVQSLQVEISNICLLLANRVPTSLKVDWSINKFAADLEYYMEKGLILLFNHYI